VCTRTQVALRFQPQGLGPAQLALSCMLNHSAASSVPLQLSGAASEPRLAWDAPSNRLFFRPTCVGASSARQLTLRNVSHVPVGWQWLLSRKLQGAVDVQPQVRVCARVCLWVALLLRLQTCARGRACMRMALPPCASPQLLRGAADLPLVCAARLATNAARPAARL
jgi:hypothetical protein